MRKPAKTARAQKPRSVARQRRPEARPDEILDAALAVFSDQGFDAARMDDIAARAGISKAGVYLYFASKEALLEALIEREVAPVADRVSALAKTGAADPAGVLKLIVATAANNLLDARIVQTPRLVLSIANRYPSIAAHYRKRVVDVAIAGVEKVFAAGVKAGVFRRAPPRAMVRAFIGPILFEAMFAHVLKGDSPFTSEQLVAQHIDILFHGIAAEAKR